MSYQVLARKWRPKTFREMVGQEHVLKALINALDHNRLHHAYLFTGTRGVGKTTIARILAKCLNCESGVSSEPCGQCTFCQSIVEGRFVDLIEVDAASRTKVEDTRELLENVQYAPTAGRYKVFLIDEVHMLSTHSFNALLKTLEEPPPHVKFLLATTDPQKLPATILSRCLQFNLKNMTPERIVEHLKHVLEQEMVSYDEQALWQLGRAADGSMRDALSLTDQAIAFGSGKLSEPDVRAMLGTIDRTAVYELVEALIDGQGAQLLTAVERLSEHAPDYAGALEELLSLLHHIAIAQAVPGAADNSMGERERIVALASRVSAEDVQLFYQLGLTGRRDLPLAPDPRSGLEMVLLRMLAFKPAGVAQLPRESIKQAAPQPTDNDVAEGDAPVKKPERQAAAPAAGVSANRPAQPSDACGEAPSVNNRAQQSTASPQPEVNTRPTLANDHHQQQTPPQATPAAPKQNNESAVSESAESLFAPPADTRAQTVPRGAQHQAEPGPALASTAASAINEQNKQLNPAQSTSPGSEQLAQTAQTKASNDARTIEQKPAELTLSSLNPQTWPRLFERLGFGGVVGNIASHCVLEAIDGDTLRFTLDQNNATLFNDSYTERIQAHLASLFTSPVKVQIQVAQTQAQTPAAFKQQWLKERKQQALQVMQNDPYVQCMVDDFNATLHADSVEALCDDTPALPSA